MPIITKIEKSGSRHPRARVYLDGRYAFSVELETALSLKEEQALSAAEIDKLARDDERRRALEVAHRALVLRPHSRREISQRLARKHFGQQAIEFAVAELTARGILNDAEFARFWRDNREAFRPRSHTLINQELRRLGVAAEVAVAVTSDIDDEAGALAAGQKKARLLSGADYDTFSRRLGDYLKRRGYSYEIIHRTIDALWKAKEG